MSEEFHQYLQTLQLRTARNSDENQHAAYHNQLENKFDEKNCMNHHMDTLKSNLKQTYRKVPTPGSEGNLQLDNKFHSGDHAQLVHNSSQIQISTESSDSSKSIQIKPKRR